LVGRLQGADLLVLSNPNRITGRLMPPREMERLLSAAADAGAATIIDESLMDFTGESGLFGPARGRVVVLRTTAFYYGLPGLELAFCSAPEELAARISAADHGVVSRLAVEAARTALKDKTYRRQVHSLLHSEKRLFQRSLGSLPNIRLYASDANVFLLRSEGPEDGPVREALAREGFFVRDCSGMEGLGSGCLRVSVMGHGANRKFVRIVRERSVRAGTT
jgi:histidinol-phosphate/aromatic aminotransferase/cobyric acid decarboxylase-like protein